MLVFLLEWEFVLVLERCRLASLSVSVGDICREGGSDSLLCVVRGVFCWSSVEIEVGTEIEV